MKSRDKRRRNKERRTKGAAFPFQSEFAEKIAERIRTRAEALPVLPEESIETYLDHDAIVRSLSPEFQITKTERLGNGCHRHTITAVPTPDNNAPIVEEFEVLYPKKKEA